MFFLDTLLNGIMGFGLNAYNNEAAAQRAQQDRRENYMYGEMAANNADARTRALYEDIYSPASLMKQYKEAGMSPGMMLGGTPGQGGISGAHGTGAAGPQTQYMPYSMMEAAQIASLAAETAKTKAETKNIETDTTHKELENAMSEIATEKMQNEWSLINSRWHDIETGEETSLFEMADKYYSYESFLNAVRNDKTDNGLKDLTTSEQGQQILRSIYTGASRFNRDIMTLSEETVSSKFQLDITKKLSEEGFIDLNAQAAISQLKQSVATNELTTQQKEAWNNLINRLGKNHSTTKDIIIVLGMILGNFANNTGIKINVGGKK